MRKVHFVTLVTILLLTGSRAQASDIPNARVHFPFNSDIIFTEDLPLIEANANWLQMHSDAVIILEGHCDENGGNDYNEELGDRRAREVKSELIKRGVEHDRIIMVVSFGEARPLDAAHNNDAWRKNRRVEFILR